ncbi:hypothetical protein N9R79_02775 [Vibrio sp.]|nr:hypothetical protein [Vibrio sp.]
MPESSLRCHYSVVELTIEDIEHSFAQNRLERMHTFLESGATDEKVATLHSKANSEARQDPLTFHDKTWVVTHLSDLRSWIPDIQQLAYHQAIEIEYGGATGEK